MSHYSVAVFHKENQNIDDLLAKYDEALDVEPYIHLTKQQAAEEMRKYSKSDEPKTEDEYYNEYLEYYAISHDMIDKNGNILSTYNPDSKWDWYQVGGRFANILKDKDGNCYDTMRVKDVANNTTNEKYNKAIAMWERLENSEDPEDKKMLAFYLITNKTKERFAQRCSVNPLTYAVVDQDGNWYSQGEMGWFGYDSSTDEESAKWCEEYYDRFYKDADEDLYVTICDLHI